MPRGAPDFGASQPLTALAHLDDDGELAARLGSVVLFDRRGTAVYVDPLSASWRRFLTSLGTGGAVYNQATAGFASDYALAIVGGSAAAATSTVTIEVPLVVSTRVGVEVLYALWESDVVARLRLSVLDGTDTINAGLEVDGQNGQLSYLDSAGAWVVRTDPFRIDTGRYVWNHLKVVIDPATELYVRAVSAAGEDDLGTPAVQNAGASAERAIRVVLEVEDPGGGSVIVTFAGLVVTVNE